MNLNLCWWNIGVTPPKQGAEKDNTNKLEMVKKYLIDFSTSKAIDLFALCEVSNLDDVFLKGVADELDLEYLSLYEIDGRMIIDISIMYESSKLELIPNLQKCLITHTPDEQKVRVGTRVVFKDLSTGELVTFFLSHWHSNLRDNTEKNEYAAISIRGHIDNIYNQHGENSQIICMGDYNCPPYSKAIHELLSSTKDFYALKDKPKVLFNPCWALLSDGKSNNFGTYFHHGKQKNRWHVFDQIMFSSSFASGAEKKLKIDKSSIYTHRILDDENKHIDKVFFDTFDHTPIFCRVYHDTP